MEQRFEKDIHGGQFGNIHNHYEQKPVRTRPRIAVTCPQCQQETWRYNELCNSEAGCTFGIRAHFDMLEQIEREREEIRRRESNKQFCFFIGIVGFIISIAISYIGTQWFDSPKMSFWFLGGLIWLIGWLKTANEQV
jgi:hypothetical protein|nr:MAG TPA: RNA polymerase-like protein [Caudoviricetes sp.]